MFFTSSLADGLSQKSEWQQVSSSLHDSSKYSGRSQQCCSLDGLYSSSYFPVLQSLYQSFGACTKRINDNWYNCHFHVPHFFLFPSKVHVLILLFTFYQFYSVVSRDSKVHNSASSLFCGLLLGLVLSLLLLLLFVYFFIFVVTKSKWSQISAALQDFSKYSSWSQYCRRLHIFTSSLDSESPIFFSWFFEIVLKALNIIGINHFHVPYFFKLSGKFKPFV